VCDSINYLLNEEDILAVFKLVNNYLYPGGIFIFDFNTKYKYETVIGDTTIAENRDDCSFIWENYYDPETFINEYDLTVFIKEKDEIFRRFSETHIQRGYTLEEIKALLDEAGLSFVEAKDCDTDSEPSCQSERIRVVAKECTKDLGETVNE
ncbi:MAG: class I SAM-dependent methyltransferase, partial [Lachnospiraceae bacterium]|nr:class I SAM-dependent methyltransferase [Lachnospiraceae bacterium]